MNKRFVYYNARPDGEREEDCVCRAITLATGLRYNTIEKLLDMTAACYGCDALFVDCYAQLLEDVFGFRGVPCFHAETVADIARAYPNNKVLIRINGHLTVSISSFIFDTWDCSDELVDRYWVVE